MTQARTRKHAVALTAGEWSPLLDARVDLEQAEAAMRRSRNMLLETVGSVTRRQGFRFVSAVRAACITFDPVNGIPDWGTLSAEESLTQVDQYGSLGFPAVRVSDGLPSFFQPCPFIDWADGPETEAFPNLTTCNRQVWRWRAVLSNGSIFYGRTGFPIQPAPPSLVPSDLHDAVNLAFCFDQVARPCFAVDRTDSGKVNLWRFVGGTPTFWEWDGHSPLLFFNGITQRDFDFHDVVCYYIREGVLRARFQRDLMDIEYTIADPSNVEGPGQLARLIKSDAGRIGPNAIYHFISAFTAGERFLMFRSAGYDAFPVCMEEAGTVAAALGGGLYELHIIPAPAVSESLPLAATLSGGSYDPVIVDAPGASSRGAVTAALSGGVYFQIVIHSPSQTDSAEVSAQLTSGSYEKVIVNADLSEDGAGVRASLSGGAYSPA